MIMYSHLYDLFAKLLMLALIVFFFILIQADVLIAKLVVYWHLKPSQGEFILFLSGVAALILLVLFLYLPWLSPAAAWCYLRFSLKTPVDWATAVKVESLFRPTLRRLNWYPLRELKSLPAEERIPELLRFYEHLKNSENEPNR